MAKRDILERLKSAKNSAELAALLPDIQEERVSTQQKLDSLNIAREDAILLGTEAREKLRRESLDLKDYLDDLDAASRVTDRKLKEFRDKENDETLIASSKKWATDAKIEFELRDKWLALAAEAYRVHHAYFQAREKGNAWRTTIGRADALGLKPVDPLADILAKNNVSWPHPVNDQALLKGLQAAANFKNYLDGIGVKAA